MPLLATAPSAPVLVRSLRRRLCGIARSSSSSCISSPSSPQRIDVDEKRRRVARTTASHRRCFASKGTSTKSLLGRDNTLSERVRPVSSSAFAFSSSSPSTPDNSSADTIDSKPSTTTSTTTTASNMPEKLWSNARVPPTPSELLETNRQWHVDADPEMFASLSKGQKPAIAWIGCSDSRVPAELVTGAAPGDLFVHRNIANTFNPKDPSALAFLAYAVNALGVSHVIVCGHLNCGGVQAALASAKDRQAININTEVDEGTEAIQNWLTPLRSLAVANLRTSSSFAAEVDPVRSLRSLVEQNVCAQVSNVASCSVVKNAWRQGKSLTVHGWVYDLSTGKIEDLKVSEGTNVEEKL